MEIYCPECRKVFPESDFLICPYCGTSLKSRVGRQPIPRELRHTVFQRDGYRCCECGATNKETTLEIDHIIPVAEGGTNDIDNLQTLCKECNRAKLTDEWVGGESDLTSLKNELETLKNTQRELKQSLNNYLSDDKELDIKFKLKVNNERINELPELIKEENEKIKKRDIEIEKSKKLKKEKETLYKILYLKDDEFLTRLFNHYNIPKNITDKNSKLKHLIDIHHFKLKTEMERIEYLKVKELTLYLKTHANNESMIKSLTPLIKSKDLTSKSQIDSKIREEIERQEEEMKVNNLINHLNSKTNDETIIMKLTSLIKSKDLTSTYQIDSKIREEIERQEEEMNVNNLMKYLNSKTKNMVLIKRLTPLIKSGHLTSKNQIDSKIKEETETKENINNLIEYLDSQTSDEVIIGRLRPLIRSKDLTSKSQIDSKIIEEEKINDLIEYLWMQTNDEKIINKLKPLIRLKLLVAKSQIDYRIKSLSNEI